MHAGTGFVVTGRRLWRILLMLEVSYLAIAWTWASVHIYTRLAPS